MKIVVIGSSNIDMVARVSRLPLPGETVGGAQFLQSLGGKGANQAVAAARLGGDVTFVTSLGNDIYADMLRRCFDAEGIRTDYVMNDAGNPTGSALIMVADSGENCIAVAPGANSSLLLKHMKQLKSLIEEAEIVVMQAEIPYVTIKEVALLVRRAGKKLLFNPAPACSIDEELMKSVGVLVVNEVEASFISGMEYTGNNYREMALQLIKKGARQVVITLGSQGVYMESKYESLYLPGHRVNVSDTTAAGDTFCGALAVSYAQGNIDEEALKFANAAAAISVTRSGAQSSIPIRKEVEIFLQSHENSIVV